MARVTIHRVPKEHIFRIWPILYAGVLTYIEKTPHLIGTPNEVLANWLDPDGDELIVIMLDGKAYAGFCSFKILHMEGEIWATLAMIYADEKNLIGEVSILEEAMPLAKDLFKQMGCTHMNYFTARRGFRRLAPRLGFRSRIIEWITEVD